MCTCIDDLTKKLKELYNGKFKKKDIENISINTLISFSGKAGETFSEATISLVGQKKEHSIVIAHTYCPFCGEMYES